MRVRIVRNQPQEDQDLLNIEWLMGKEFEVVAHWKQHSNDLECGKVQINVPEIGGLIILNKEEYEIIK